MSTSLDQSFRIDPAELPGQTVIFGGTPTMREIHSRIDSVLSVDLPVLIQGESGTGKELIARAIHENSARAKKPFITINCGAFPETLLESELFGYVKGSFTGANENRRGLFQAADGGTLFMDEIGNMSVTMQVKLYRVLQESKVRPIGSTEESDIDVRVIARGVGGMLALLGMLAVVVAFVRVLRSRRGVPHSPDSN